MSQAVGIIARQVLDEHGERIRYVKGWGRSSGKGFIVQTESGQWKHDTHRTVFQRVCAAARRNLVAAYTLDDSVAWKPDAMRAAERMEKFSNLAAVERAVRDAVAIEPDEAVAGYGVNRYPA